MRVLFVFMSVAAYVVNNTQLVKKRKEIVDLVLDHTHKLVD